MLVSWLSIGELSLHPWLASMRLTRWYKLRVVNTLFFPIPHPMSVGLTGDLSLHSHSSATKCYESALCLSCTWWLRDQIQDIIFTPTWRQQGSVTFGASFLKERSQWIRKGSWMSSPPTWNGAVLVNASLSLDGIVGLLALMLHLKRRTRY